MLHVPTGYTLCLSGLSLLVMPLGYKDFVLIRTRRGLWGEGSSFRKIAVSLLGMMGATIGVVVGGGTVSLQ